jgi:hypothetical protein
MFTIKVIEQTTGKPLKDKRICVFFDGLFRGHTKDIYSDKDGEAHFDYDNGIGEVYVDGKKRYTGKIEGRKILYL